MKLLTEFLEKRKYKQEKSFYENITENGLGKRNIPSSIIKDKDKFIKAINCHDKFFDDFVYNKIKKRQKERKRITNDSEIMLSASFKSVWSFKYASENLKSDPTFVAQAIKQKPCIYEFINEEFKESTIFANKAAKNYGCFAFKTHRKFLEDLEIAAIAIQTNPEQMPVFSQKITHQLITKNPNYYLPLLKDNLFHVRNIGWIQFNKKIIFQIGKEKPEVMRFASKSLQENLTFNLKLIQANPTAFSYLTEKLKRHPLIQLKAVQNGLKLETLYPFISYAKKSLESEEGVSREIKTHHFMSFFKRIADKKEGATLSNNTSNLKLSSINKMGC